MAETVKKTTAKNPKAKAAKEPKAPTEAKAPKAAKAVSKANGAAAAAKTSPSEKSKSNLAEMPIPRERIEELARKFWAERGYTDGHHEEDWYRAERELRGMAS